MEKKRFSVLEVDGLANPAKKKDPCSNQKKVQPPLMVEVIIPDKEFERNLKIHRLEKQKKELELMKKIILVEQEQVEAWLPWAKIILGIAAILMSIWYLIEFWQYVKVEDYARLKKSGITMAISLIIGLYSFWSNRKKRK